MMVGVNETWYGFMDEGFNQYMNILSEADYAHQVPKLDSLGLSYGRISGNELEAPLMWDENYAGPLYSFAAYGKAPMMLSSLGGVVGDSAVQRAMSEYAKAWRFKHPSPWDYAFFMNNALHQDLGWFWNYWLFTTESVDGSIQNVSTAGRRTTVTVRQNGQMPSPIILKVEFAPGNAVNGSKASVPCALGLPVVVVQAIPHDRGGQVSALFMLWGASERLGILPKLLDDADDRIDLALDPVRGDNRLFAALQDGDLRLGPLVAMVIVARLPCFLDLSGFRAEVVKIHAL
jgi:hypothetical protein